MRMEEMKKEKTKRKHNYKTIKRVDADSNCSDNG